jgi:tetratricopeptide (TPR) repeat protein
MPTSLPDLNELATRVGEVGRAAETDPSQREAFVEVLLEFCAALLEQHEFDDAAAASTEAVRVVTDLIEGGRDELRGTLAIALRHHADALLELDEIDLALGAYANAIESLAQLDSAQLATTLLHYGEALRRCGRAEEALELLGRALHEGTALTGELADATRSKILSNRGKALAELGCVDEAVAASREAVAVFEAREGSSSSPAPVAGLAYANALDALATLLRSLGRADEAIEPAERGLEVVTGLAQIDGIRHLLALARMTNNLARCNQQAERFDRAAALFEQAVDGFRILAESQPHAHAATLIQVLSNHALARAQAGELERAHALALETLALAEASEGWGQLPLIIGVRQFLADLAQDLERPSEAVDHLVAGLRLLHRAIDESMPGAAEAATRLGASAKAVADEHAITLPDDVLTMLGP